MTTAITIEAGTRVRYAREFLRNTGQFTGWAPSARGTVLSVEPFGDKAIAYIRWDGHSQSSDGMAVLTGNLVREDRVHLERA